MTSEILLLRIDDVVPDPEQPRQYFEREALDRLKSAILAVGQLNPIRVRRVDDRWMIVDGQRRWLSLCSLAKQYPDDARFASIKAYVGEQLDEEATSRRVVQVLSNVAEDLTPSEKAEVLEEVLRKEPHLSIEMVAQRLGMPKGQAQFLRQLVGAPDFIKALGRGGDDGAALPLWNLVTLVRLHRKLRKWDDEQFRETEGAHGRVADTEVRRLGQRARDEGWGKRKVEAEAERVLRRVQGESTEPRKVDRLASIQKVLSSAEQMSAAERKELVDLLRTWLDKLTDGEGTKRTARAKA